MHTRRTRRPFLFASLVVLIRTVTIKLGTVLGTAFDYTASAALLWPTKRSRSLPALPGNYMFVGGALFMFDEFSLALAAGFTSEPLP